MRWIARMVAFLAVIALAGCGPSKPEYATQWAQRADAWPKRGQPGTGVFQVTMGKAGDSTWAGRTMKVTIRSEADISIEPAEKELTLDATGTAMLEFKYTAVKTAAKESYPVTFTVTGQDNFTAVLPGELSVRLGE